jgi:hypothetical protein
MDIPTLQTQPPLLQRNLIPKEDFCKFCDENGLTVTEEDLETLHREGLLFPVLKVELGYAEFRKIFAVFDERSDTKEWRFVHHGDEDKFPVEKIEDTPYYTTGSLSYGSDDWLRWYEGMVSFPSAQPYFPWKKRVHAYFTLNKEEADGMYELMYDKYQIFAVEMIRSSLTYKSDIFPLTCDKLRKDRLLERLAELYQFLGFYFNAKEMHSRWIRHGYERYDALKKEVGENNAMSEWQLEFADDHLRAMKKEAAAMLKTHRMEARDISQWLNFLARQSILSRHEKTRTYLAEVQEKTLVSTELSNQMIHVLNDFLFGLNKEKRTVKDVLNRSVRHCEICHRAFTPQPNHPDQLTCGETSCVNEHRNKKKRLEASQKHLPVARVPHA